MSEATMVTIEQFNALRERETRLKARLQRALMDYDTLKKQQQAILDKYNVKTVEELKALRDASVAEAIRVYNEVTAKLDRLEKELNNFETAYTGLKNPVQPVSNYQR